MPGRDPPVVQSMSAGLIDRAETFAETDVTAKFLTKASESLEIPDVDGSAASWGYGQTYTSTSGSIGVFATPQVPIQAPRCHVSGATSGVSQVELIGPNGVKDTQTGTDLAGTWVAFDTQLQQGVEYEFRAYWNGTKAQSPGAVTTSPDWSIGTIEGMIDQIDAEQTDTAVGQVEWPQPNDVFRWDSVLFQTSPDGETVTVDVQESADGSTWTTIATNVTRGQEITADPQMMVRLKINLSRSNTANNPTLDAAYRRYIV